MNSTKTCLFRFPMQKEGTNFALSETVISFLIFNRPITQFSYRLKITSWLTFRLHMISEFRKQEIHDSICRCSRFEIHDTYGAFRSLIYSYWGIGLILYITHDGSSNILKIIDLNLLRKMSGQWSPGTKIISNMMVTTSATRGKRRSEIKWNSQAS